MPDPNAKRNKQHVPESVFMSADAPTPAPTAAPAPKPASKAISAAEEAEIRKSLQHGARQSQQKFAADAARASLPQNAEEGRQASKALANAPGTRTFTSPVSAPKQDLAQEAEDRFMLRRPAPTSDSRRSGYSFEPDNPGSPEAKAAADRFYAPEREEDQRRAAVPTRKFEPAPRLGGPSVLNGPLAENKDSYNVVREPGESIRFTDAPVQAVQASAPVNGYVDANGATPYSAEWMRGYREFRKSN